MEEWKEYKLGEITNMKNGKKRPQSNGVFPIYGGNGIIDYSDTYNAENAIIVGRVGAYCGCVYKCDGKCWVSDNAISVSAKEIVDVQFLYYLMTTLDFHHHHIGGAQPLMTQDIIGDFTVTIPPMSVQYQIVKILKSLDDKIEMNRQDIENILVYSPQNESVKDFGKLVLPMIKQILINCKESRRLASLRDALLPRLMSGEIKVGDVAL